MPASSLIAVTVCTDPAISCSLPNAAQFIQVHPKNIGLAADGTGSVNNQIWSGWGVRGQPPPESWRSITAILTERKEPSPDARPRWP
jgi:hypothetical protein